MSYPALAVANYFIDKANVENTPLDHLKLQKLVYFAHGWNLAVRAEPLIDEPVEAWKYGPVVSSLYRTFRVYGNDLVTENGVQMTALGPRVPNIEFGDSDTRELLAKVWEVYQGFSGVQLSNMTHEPDTPWDRTWRKSRRSGEEPIANDLIREHFLEKARRRGDETRKSGAGV